jgi:hypothetical protein
VEGEVVLCIQGIEERLAEGGESLWPVEGKKEAAAAMEERAVRVLGERNRCLKEKEGKWPAGDLPSVATLAQPVADSMALPSGLANGRARRRGEGGG